MKQYWKSPAGTTMRKQLSESRMGNNNPVHKQSKETRKRMSINNSKIMKEKILKGEFTPNVTNSWCFSRVIVADKAFRSSWEAVFFILNPLLKYEKIRIPYTNIKGEECNYIVDFVDDINKIIYEIKPEATKEHSNNRLKEVAAIEWCKLHNFEYHCISNKWFYDNARKIDYSLYDPKIRKSMKQFLNEN